MCCSLVAQFYPYDSQWLHTHRATYTWWRHEIETLPALLSLCESLVDSLHKGPVMRTFGVSLMLARANFGQTLVRVVMWDVMRAMWRHCNELPQCQWSKPRVYGYVHYNCVNPNQNTKSSAHLMGRTVFCITKFKFKLFIVTWLEVSHPHSLSFNGYHFLISAQLTSPKATAVYNHVVIPV